MFTPFSVTVSPTAEVTIEQTNSIPLPTSLGGQVTVTGKVAVVTVVNVTGDLRLESGQVKACFSLPVVGSYCVPAPLVPV